MPYSIECLASPVTLVIGTSSLPGGIDAAS
jgi:hypothetical protein